MRKIIYLFYLTFISFITHTNQLLAMQSSPENQIAQDLARRIAMEILGIQPEETGLDFLHRAEELTMLLWSTVPGRRPQVTRAEREESIEATEEFRRSWLENFAEHEYMQLANLQKRMLRPPVQFCEELCCSICLDQMNTNQTCKIFSCDHRFHGKCLSDWLKSHNTCPLCRCDLTAP